MLQEDSYHRLGRIYLHLRLLNFSLSPLALWEHYIVAKQTLLAPEFLSLANNSHPVIKKPKNQGRFFIQKYPSFPNIMHTVGLTERMGMADRPDDIDCVDIL